MRKGISWFYQHIILKFFATSKSLKYGHKLRLLDDKEYIELLEKTIQKFEDSTDDFISPSDNSKNTPEKNSE